MVPMREILKLGIKMYDSIILVCFHIYHSKKNGTWMAAMNQPLGSMSRYTVYGLKPFSYYEFAVRAYLMTGYYKDSPISELIMTAPGSKSTRIV